MQKKTKKTPVKQKKKAQSPKKKNDQPFSLKRLIMGEEKPDLTELEAGSTTILDILSPTTIDTKSRDYIVVDGIFHAYLYVAGYGYSTTVGSCWLAPLVEAGEGVNLSFIFKRQPKEKILSKIAQTTMVNRSRMRDVGDTRQDFEELDSAISSGLYLKDAINRQGEDFYYMHTLIEVTAEDAETLEQRVTAVEKLCVSIDMIARRCDYKNEQAFLSMLPLLALDPDVERKSRRNALTSGVAAAFPFASYELSDRNGIFLGLNLYNRSPVFLDPYDDYKYTNGNCWAGCTYGCRPPPRTAPTSWPSGENPWTATPDFVTWPPGTTRCWPGTSPALPRLWGSGTTSTWTTSTSFWTLPGCPMTCCSPVSSGLPTWQTTSSWMPAATCPPSSPMSCGPWWGPTPTPWPPASSRSW